MTVIRDRKCLCELCLPWQALRRLASLLRCMSPSVTAAAAAATNMMIMIVDEKASIFQFVEICPSALASISQRSLLLLWIDVKSRLIWLMKMKSGAQTSVLTVVAAFIVAACLAASDSWMMLCVASGSVNEQQVEKRLWEATAEVEVSRLRNLWLVVRLPTRDEGVNIYYK